jgi:L-2-hydroxyglutarate oxidase LhgO
VSETSYDIAIVGGGIIGLATALALSEQVPGMRLAVLEKEARLAAHRVIHAGIYYAPGSYKARLCVEGMKLMHAFCDMHEIRYERCGKVIVATSPDELPRLDRLYERGVANGVEGLERIGPERVREIEPHANALQAIYSPATGIVDFGEVSVAMAKVLQGRGAAILTGARVERIARADGGVVLETVGGRVRARALINCAGLYADRVARLMGIRTGVRIIPFRGEYYNVLPVRRHLVRGLIYPVPDPAFPLRGRWDGRLSWLVANGGALLANGSLRTLPVTQQVGVRSSPAAFGPRDQSGRPRTWGCRCPGPGGREGWRPR